jgi:hypothetical protein
MRSANALLLVLLLGGCSQKARVATATTKLSDSPSKFVLYLLDPGSLEHNESVQTATVFHGYGILGRAEITDAASAGASIPVTDFTSNRAAGQRTSSSASSASKFTRMGSRVAMSFSPVQRRSAHSMSHYVATIFLSHPNEA